ncbi:metal-dependent hydrolase [Methanothermobacter thermautotrophicus]|jgi:L-ascorbate metabolism protein UlaG (beta-lactamase superfamily)|uniref:metal-dependent hydrolase n=1 Tax=Methanothermobacter thermautotrophicus TaxID=145262 RepID=UPI0019855B9A|nr:metal-dependent hydrolase [Methanothermobacter sp.]
MRIQWFGHSAFEITSSDTRILLDPFISNNPVCSTAVEEFEPDVICVTHGHADHLGDAMEIAERTGALLIANHELSVFFSRQGLESTGMNIGGKISIDGVGIRMVDAKHSSDIDFTEEVTSGGSACGFIIESREGKVYHAGDTGLFADMRDVIGEIYRPDIALLPIGDRYTMGPEDAAVAAGWIKPEKVLPMHYNTFPVIEQNPEVFAELVERTSPRTEVVILDVGGFYEY